MGNRIAIGTALGLALLVGVTASAQSDKQGERSKDQQGETQQKDAGQSKQKDAGRSQGQAETIRGELAAVSVVGETMVDYSSGRGVLAEFTYLTILGSPADGGRQAGRGRQADSGGNDANRDNRDRGSSGSQTKDDANRDNRDRGSSGSQAKDEGSSKDQARKDRGGREGAGGMGGGQRRNVYQIAVGPETRVRDRSRQGRRGSGDKDGDQGGSARGQSPATLERLELGDRVEVEFTRMEGQGQGQGQSASGGEGQKGNASHRRHGRHRIIRGVASMITILSTPDQDGGRGGPEERKGDDSSRRGRSSGSDSQGKDSGQQE